MKIIKLLLIPLILFSTAVQAQEISYMGIIGRGQALGAKDQYDNVVPVLGINSSGNTFIGARTGGSLAFGNTAITGTLSVSGISTFSGLSVYPNALSTAEKGIFLGASTQPADVPDNALWVVSDINTVTQAAFQQSTVDANGVIVDFNKTRKTDNTADTIVANGDAIGNIRFRAADGTNFATAAAIVAKVDGAPGSGDMPGRLEFYTTIDGTTTLHQRWIMNALGQIVQDGAGGGSILLTRANTSVAQTAVNTISAAGTTTADATALTGVINYVTTVASGTGVRLWDAPAGSIIVVHNLGANALLVYPQAGGQISGYAVDAGASIATSGSAICTRRAAGGANSWYCSEAPIA